MSSGDITTQDTQVMDEAALALAAATARREVECKEAASIEAGALDLAPVKFADNAKRLRTPTVEWSSKKSRSAEPVIKQPKPTGAVIKREPVPEPTGTVIKQKPVPEPTGAVIKREPVPEPTRAVIQREPVPEPTKPTAEIPPKPWVPEPIQKEPVPIKTGPFEDRHRPAVGTAAPVDAQTDGHDEHCGNAGNDETKPCPSPKAKAPPKDAVPHAMAGKETEEAPSSDVVPPSLVSTAGVITPSDQNKMGKKKKNDKGADSKPKDSENGSKPEEPPAKKKPGRPKGSTNQPKAAAKATPKAKAKAKAKAAVPTRSPVATPKKAAGKKRKAPADDADVVSGSQDTQFYSPKPKAAASKPKPKAKAKPAAKAKARKEKEAAPRQDSGLKSRKSCAYHKAKAVALKSGKSQEEAITLAKKVTRIYKYERPYRNRERERVCVFCLGVGVFVPCIYMSLGFHVFGCNPRLMLSKTESRL